MSRRTAAWVVGLVAVSSAIMVGGAVLARTLVPYAVDGRVTQIELRKGGGPGTDVWLVHIDTGEGSGDAGNDYWLDDMAAAALVNGSLRDLRVSEGAVARTARKDAWSLHLELGGSERDLVPTRQLVGPTVWAFAVVSGVVVSLVRGRRPPAG
jgi:hypothetical protein